eukprot:3049382-Rhodomonas_salina.2
MVDAGSIPDSAVRYAVCCYAMSGTNLGYGARQYIRTDQRMVLGHGSPDRHYHQTRSHTRP